MGTVAGMIAAVVFLHVMAPRVSEAVTWQPLNTLCGAPLGSANCLVGTAINTSPSLQTKNGPLTLDGGLTVSNPFVHRCDADHTKTCANDQDCKTLGAGSRCIPPATVVVNGTLHWNAADLTTWGAIVSSNDYVDLSPATLRPGYVSVANAPATLGNTAAINLKAGAPSGSIASYGVKASDNLSQWTSYAVRAKSGINSTKSTALRAIAPVNAQNAWAAYFQGNVSVEQPFSLVMGGQGSLDADISSSLCLGGYDAAHPRVCYSEWPSTSVGDDQWYDTGLYLQIKNAGVNLAVGGSDSNAPFFVTAKSDSRADISVYGTGQSETLTIQ